MTTLKKYENRKVYDGEKVAYVPMLELGDRVAAGEEVKVVCDRTGEDVTLEVLARALYDRLRHRDRKKPAPFEPADLVKLIRKIRRKS